MIVVLLYFVYLKSYEVYKRKINKNIRIQCYCVEYGYCGCLLTDITKQKDIEENLKISDDMLKKAIMR